MSSQRVPGGGVHKLPADLRKALIASTAALEAWMDITQVYPEVYELVVIIGLAVGVDHSLFYLRREREERASGRSPVSSSQPSASASAM